MNSFLIKLNNMSRRIYELWRFRELIVQLTIRDIMIRYKGSYLGFTWAIINPLLMLLVYCFIFIVVFKLKWSGQQGNDSNTLYSFMIFSGLIPFYIFSESVNRSLGLIPNSQNYVKKVVFPLEILPISLVSSTIINNLFGLALLVAGKLIFLDSPSWTLIYLPLLLLPLFLFSLGLSLLFSALGAYVRDLTHTISLIINILFYMSPIFYNISSVPSPFRRIIELNPLTPIINQWRNVIILGENINVTQFVGLFLFSFIIFCIGYIVFHYLRKGFSDVI